MLGYIALAVMVILGALMLFSPETCVRADKRDDPEAVSQIKNFGKAMLGFAAMAALLMLKYKLF
ncbi:MAG: hypothetical protein IJ071_12615 [Ruminococcus sp.]|nr:hypothetical protein [Ruminococcus sp.]